VALGVVIPWGVAPLGPCVAWVIKSGGRLREVQKLGCWAREGAVVRVVRKGRQVRPANVFEVDAVPLYLLSTLSPDTVLPGEINV
jgi:hypothetical protein